MKKTLLLLWIVLMGLFATAAEDTIWQEPDAEYRLELSTEHPENCTGFPLGRHLLPTGLEQGLVVYDGQGNKLGYNFTAETGFLLIAPAPANSYRLVYFGFKKPHPKQNWQKKDGPMPGGFSLAMEITRNKIDYPVVFERFKKRKKTPDASAFLGYFTARHRRVDTIPTDKVQLTAAPKRYHKNTGITFTGMLKIDQANDFAVKLETNSSALLEIDGRTILFQFGETPAKAKIEKQTLIRLEAGCHLFRLYYQYNEGPPQLNVTWRFASEKDFHPLTADAFHPGWPAETGVLRNQTGQKFPLVKRQWVRHFFVNKDEKLSWQRFELTGRYEHASWQVDGVEISRGNSADILLRDPEKQKIKIDAGRGTTPFETHVGLDYQEEKIVYPDLYLRTFAPLMIFDDEESELTLEATSGISGIVYTTMEFFPSRKNSVWSTTTESITLGQSRTGKNEFAPADYWKQSYILPPTIMEQPFGLNLNLKMGGRIFDRCRIEIKPLKDLKEIRGGENGFTDVNGTRIIPVLHRPSLAERRAWALPIRVEGTWSASRHLLVITDRHDLADALVKTLTAPNTTIEFLFWPEDGSSQFKDLLQSFILMHAALRQSKADSVLVMPPSYKEWSWLPPSTMPLLLAGLLESAVTNPALRTVVVSTPLPENIDGSGVETRWNETIRKLARDYDIPLMDLNSILKPIPDDAGTARIETWAKLFLKNLR